MRTFMKRAQWFLLAAFCLFISSPAWAVDKDAKVHGNTVDLNRNFDCEWKAKGVWQNTAVSGGSAEAVAAAAEYLARAPGLTGQLISLDDLGAGAVLPLPA